jgi:transposase
MVSRGDLTDDEWALLKPLLPVSNKRCGRWRDHRQVINGIIQRLGTGVRWPELPGLRRLLAEAVRQASVWAARAAGSPPRST